MDLNALLNDNKGAISELLGGLNLSSNEVDKTIDSTKAVVGDAIAKESSGGLGTLLNLFSDDDNSSSSNSFLKNIDSSLVKKLVSSGINKQKAGSIKGLVVPFVVKLVASKIGGNSDLLSSLLGGLSSGNSKGPGGLLGKLFN